MLYPRDANTACGDGLLELVDLIGDGLVAGNSVVDRIEPVGVHRQLAAIQRHDQLAEVLPFLAGLDHRACGR